jgi:uncharacterized membrane protein
LRKEIFDAVKEEYRSIAMAFGIFVIILKIAFFRDSFYSILKTAISLFWLFAIPGYFIMLKWKGNLDFLERIFIGTFLAAALSGLLSYHAGLIGLNLRYHVAGSCIGNAKTAEIMLAKQSFIFGYP